MSINPSFKLRKPQRGVPVSIYLSFYHKYQKYVYGTGKIISPSLWDFETERPTQNKGITKKLTSTEKTELENIHARLENIATETKRFFSYCQQQQIAPTKEMLKEHLDAEIKKKVAQKPVTVELNEFIDQFIKDIETGAILTEKGKRYTKGTIKNYLGFKSQLDAYQKKRRKTLTFDSITIDFYDDYLAFFNSKNYSPNTTGRHIKNLKVVMRQAWERGLHNNHEWERRKFKTIQVETESIYLNQKELRQLADLDLSNEPHMEVVRDVFLIGCHTAQRYSDYSRINPSHITTTTEGTKVIELKQQKTGIKVVIPISRELDALLSKYQYQTPKTHSQKVNERIKILGGRAGITEPITTSRQKNGFEVMVDVLKCDLIKTHTARRSGATNMYLGGVPTLDIMKITGHKTEREFLKYIKVSKEQTADRLALHPFFNQAPLRVAK